MRYLSIFAIGLALAGAGCGSDGVGPGPDEGRVPPVAAAGADLVVADLDEDGLEEVVLSGCESKAGSHPIATYGWREGRTELHGVQDDAGCTLSVELSVGTHALTLTVVDEAGRSDEDAVEVDVRSPRPEVTIDSPSNQTGFATGTEVVLRASATDWTGSPLESEQIVWRSDLDGLLGHGSRVARDDLSKGRHAIVLTATDDDGFESVASVEIAVGDPPTVRILSPETGTVCPAFGYMQLEGSCTDENGDPIGGSGLLWETALVQAQYRHEPSMDLMCTGAGFRVITLACTDANGITSRAQVQVEYVHSFRFNILAVLVDFGCTGCHGQTAQEGGIRLDTYEAVTTGGNANGPLIVVGDATQGILIPKLLARHYDPDRSTLTTPFFWGWVMDLEGWWVQQMLAPWINRGALDN